MMGDEQMNVPRSGPGTWDYKDESGFSFSWLTPPLPPCTEGPGRSQAPDSIQRHPLSISPERRDLTYFFLFFLFLFLLFRAAPSAYEVPRLGVELELQLPAPATATATPDRSHISNLHHNSRQRLILNPLSKARDRTHILMDPSCVHYHGPTVGTPDLTILKSRFL